MFKKVLVANRGEIALRIIRACKELGVSTVAVHSDVDANSLHVRFADEDVCIGPAHSSQSYLNVPGIISAAEITNADAIHPGYGFLAESTYFAEVCESCGLTFIGPPVGVMRKMGDKAYARRCMREAGVPVLPGSDWVVRDLREAKELAGEIGYPLILKAASGGGGRGMRVARNVDELESCFNIATSEAQSTFGNSELYLEHFIEKPRHIEFQIIGDKYGNIIHLGERDCSIQRKRQKLMEESPSPAVDQTLREEMIRVVLKAAKSIGYQNVGTMEFLMDSEANFYFLEMNTRIQVEHPVTEMVTGVDILKEQIKTAAGEKLGYKQQDINLSGHALECRINAEDPEENFAPSPGTITGLHFPGGIGIRIDTHIYQPYQVPPFYDSLLSKVISHGKNREEALLRMQRALEEFTIEGVKTTIPFYQRILKDSCFKNGEADTTYAERIQQEIQEVERE